MGKLLPEIFRRIIDLAFPVLAIAAGTVIGSYTFLHILLVERSPRRAIDFNYWRSRAFARIWRLFAPMAAKSVERTVSPLASLARGVVLDIGPGDGQNLAYYERENISKLYLVEPCVEFHDTLHQRLRRVGLADIATVIGCGVQDRDILRQHQITPASIDTIVTFSVLCSVPAPEETSRFLYSLLKPGGQWILLEHVLAQDKYPLARLVQNLFQIAWAPLMGGCNLNRDTGRYVKSAGSWSQVDLTRGEDEAGWEMLGHIAGKLVK